MKHTKGPWKIRYQFGNPDSYPCTIVSDYSPTYKETINPKEPDADAKLPICSFLHEAKKYTQANAYLIAQAPLMLEHLEEILAALDQDQLDKATELGIDTLIIDIRETVRLAKGDLK